MTAVVDLGEVGADPPGGPRQPWRFVARARLRGLRQRVDRTRSRRWPATVTLVLVLLLTTAARPPAEPEPLWTLSAAPGSSVVGAGHLYRLVPAGGNAEVVARRLADGAVTWRTRVATPDGNLGLYDGTLVSMDGDDRGLTGLDPATGRERWRVAGGPPDSAFGGWIAIRRTGSAPSSARWAPESMTAVHARTGRIGGQVQLPADYVNAYPWEAPDGTPYVFTIDCDAWLVKHDLWAGGEVARIRTRHDPGEEPCDEQGPVYRGGGSQVGDNGLLVVPEAGATAPVQTVYDAQTLAPLWRVLVDWRVEDCGPVVCLSDGPRLRAVEPRTGAIRWELRCGPAPLRCQVGSSVHAGRLWIPLSPPEGSQPGGRTTRLIVDPVTGQRRAGRTPWEVAAEVGGASGQTLLLRFEDDEFRDEESDRTRVWWARSGPDLSELRLLFDVTAEWCQPAYPYLVCKDRRQISIWWSGRR